jgi:uncharacterized protein with HEPN domain
MQNNEYGYISHIKKHCVRVKKSIERFGDSIDVFEIDDDYFDSILMKIQQIGELIKGLTNEYPNFISDHANEHNWKQAIRLRDRTAHGYATLNKGIIWATATNDIPALLDFCNTYLDER